MTRIVVCGGRNFEDYEKLKETIDQIVATLEEVEIVSGHAKGADSLGEKYAEEKGIKCVTFPADWKTYGKSAGFLRNSQMIEYAKGETPLVIAFWNGESHGTKDTIDKAEKEGIKTIIVRY